MSQTVFILGAGASAEAGAPVMQSFLGIAEGLKRSGQLTGADSQDFDLVFRARKKLQSVFSKSHIDINNIESLFGIFEMAALLGKLGDLPDSDVERLPQAMARVIARTIEKTVQFPVTKNHQRVEPPLGYFELTRVIRELSQLGEDVAVITFNYDVGLDYAFHYTSTDFSYCLELAAPPTPVRLLKLHGSLNWSRCERCQGVVQWSMREFFDSRLWLGLDSAPFVRLDISTNLKSQTHCGFPLEDSFIVTPTWNKGRHHSQLANVWRAAAAELANAERVIVIGYSLPSTDEFFKYFYALGSVGEAIPSLFCIVDMDSAPGQRFQQILGPLTARPPCFRTVQSSFVASIPTLREYLALKRTGAGA